MEKQQCLIGRLEGIAGILVVHSGRHVLGVWSYQTTASFNYLLLPPLR